MLRKNYLHKDNSFKVPEGYFDNLEDAILTGMSFRDGYIPSTNNFKVPDGFFDNMEDRIEIQLRSGNNVISLYRKNKKRLVAVAGIAAVFILMVSIIKPFMFKNNIDNIPATEVEDYINSNYTSLFSLDFEDYFSSEDEIEQFQILNNNAITEEELIEYINENIDPYEELTIIE